MFTIILMFVLIAACKLEAVEIDCEKVDHYERFEKCCYLDGTTEIREINDTIADLENTDVDVILFRGKEKNEFLPVNVYEKFPNLEVYLATKAAVEEILALNFQSLSKLRLLDFSDNLIKSIPDDCFQGLTKLNKIKLSMKANLCIWS